MLLLVAGPLQGLADVLEQVLEVAWVAVLAAALGQVQARMECHPGDLWWPWRALLSACWKQR